MKHRKSWMKVKRKIKDYYEQKAKNKQKKKQDVMKMLIFFLLKDKNTHKLTQKQIQGWKYHIKSIDGCTYAHQQA